MYYIAILYNVNHILLLYNIFKKDWFLMHYKKNIKNWELGSNALMWLECILLVWPQGSFHYSSRYNCYCKLMSLEYTISFRGIYSKKML